MGYKIAIFDMDGTILDTLQDLKDAVNISLSKNHFPEHTLDEVRFFVGNGIKNLVKRAAPENSTQETLDKIYKDFTEWYSVHCQDKTKPYNGIPELIKELKDKGIKTAVVSNKDDYAVKQLAEKFFPGLFDYAIGAAKDRKIKPAPDSINYILKESNLSSENAVYIGDSDVDIQTAENSKMKCISVDWGFRDKQFLVDHGAYNIVSDTKSLLNEILK